MKLKMMIMKFKKKKLDSYRQPQYNLKVKNNLH